MSIELPILKSGLSIGVINIKTSEISLQDAHLINFHCKSRINCCSDLKIPVTEFDIVRIQKEGFELDQIVESLSPVIIPLKTPGNLADKVYLLKRKPFDGTCTFLEGKSCIIHKYKPFACKTYPFSLNILNDNNIQILIHKESLCKSIVPASENGSNNQILLENIVIDVIDEMKLRKIPI